jgi:prolyl 4-hydroxylase
LAIENHTITIQQKTYSGLKMFADACVENPRSLTGFTLIVFLHLVSSNSLHCRAGEMKYFSFFAIICLIIQVKSEFYSSTDKLRELFDYESEILTEFSGIITKFNDVNDHLYNKMKPWYDEHAEAQEEVDKYVTNPLNAYLMIKRNVYDVKMLEKKLTSMMDEVKVKLQKIMEKSFLHKLEVTGAVAGLIRAQRTYHLKNEDLVEGIVDGSKTRNPLSPHDIYVLAAETYKMPKEEFFSENYLRLAEKKIANGNDLNSEVNDTEILEKLKVFETLYVSDPYDESYEVYRYRDADTEKMMTHRVCRGDLTRSPSETKNLLCKFASFSTFSTIAPFKLEEASIEPYIVIYHDVFSDTEIEELLSIARPKQAKALVGLGDSYASDDDRVAQIAWLFDGHHEILKTINPRIEDMTGLAVQDPFGEALQIQNYGVGGQYYAHYDHDGGRTDESSEDRIATLMLYVSKI